jgi:hypothetical protein
MTTEERAAVRATLFDAHEASGRAFSRAKADANLDGRLMAIALTKLDEALAVALMAVGRVDVEDAA